MIYGKIKNVAVYFNSLFEYELLLLDVYYFLFIPF